MGEKEKEKEIRYLRIHFVLSQYGTSTTTTTTKESS
jgi:hypothetical protein